MLPRVARSLFTRNAKRIRVNSYKRLTGAKSVRYLSAPIKPELTYFGTKGTAKNMNTHFETKGAGHTFVADEPEVLGGTDLGPNPMEYLAAAMASCSQVMIAIIAKEMKVSVGNVKWNTDLGVDLRGLLGVEGAIVPPQTIECNAEIEVAAHDVDKMKELQQKVEARCPVYNLYKNAGLELKSTFTAKVVEKTN
mmetsp:Transcript_60061/g.95373  ORF Transcript_60061/g.95373 Transcript_60061/m.95373 type:complete len:194 (-) Transcript_60061:111-692(-)